MKEVQYINKYLNLKKKDWPAATAATQHPCVCVCVLIQFPSTHQSESIPSYHIIPIQTDAKGPNPNPRNARQ